MSFKVEVEASVEHEWMGEQSAVFDLDLLDQLIWSLMLCLEESSSKNHSQ